MKPDFDHALAAIADRTTALRLRDAALISGAKWIEQGESLPAGIGAEEVQLRFRSISVCVTHGLLQFPFFEAACDILCRGENIGIYRLITDVHGKVEDDYWVIDSMIAASLNKSAPTGSS